MASYHTNVIKSTIEYLRYLKETASKSDKIQIIESLLRQGFDYSFGSSQIELAKKSLPIINDNEITNIRLKNFCSHATELKHNTLYQKFMNDLTVLRYYAHHQGGDVEYLNRYMAATYAFYHKVHGSEESDQINAYIETVSVLTGKRLSTNHFLEDGDTTDEETPDESANNKVEPVDVTDVLGNASVWDDIDITLLKPASFIVVDEVTVMVNSDVEKIENALNARAKKGPNLGFTFMLFSFSFAGIFIVASNHTVAEKPILFRVLWGAAYLINLYTVCLPGRLDRMFVSGSHLKPWHSLFEPAQWGFAIWAVIYALQLILTVYVVAAGMPEPVLQHAVPYWLVGNWFCALWCFCFRAEFMNYLWVPLLCLIGAAGCFSMAHIEMTLKMEGFSYMMRWIITLLRLPMGLHAAWLTSAIFITLNSWVVLSGGSKGTQVAFAFGSAFVAAVVGAVYSVSCADITIALVVAWALDACSCRTLEKAHVPQAFVSQDIHEALSITESVLSNILKIVAIGIAITPALYAVRENLPDLPDL